LARTKSLSEQIRKAREGKGFTVAELADRLGVSQVSIYYWESGRVRPRDTNLAALTKALKMPVRETMATIGQGGSMPSPGRVGASSDAGMTMTMKALDASPGNRPDQRAVAHGGKSTAAANMDALLARLDKGIAAEHTAMDVLLKRLVITAPEL
jgi:transcriptional regulator with XRE-family HTH domain